MVTLLLGSDPAAKKDLIVETAAKLNSEVQMYGEGSALPNFSTLFEPQLFGAAKTVVLDHCWKKLSDEEIDQILKLGDDKNSSLYIIEDSLDKRKKVNQDFLKDKRIVVNQLDAPIGTQSSISWINSYAKAQGIAIEPYAAQGLARALLIDEDTTLDVSRVQNELAKLKSYANGKPISLEMVTQLTENLTGVDIFVLLNAIATRNKKLAMSLMDEYFLTETADEKASAIKISALLADQCRSLLITADAESRNLPDEQVMAMTGWSSKRLFMMKKLSRNFKAIQLKQTLAKLENLDRELKSGSMPPQVVLDLIIADM